MRKGIGLWVICLSLVLTRLVGLHLHACDGIEAGAKHAGTHLADNGFLFGEHHSEDDGDDREVEVAAVVASKILVHLPDLAAPRPAALTLDPLAERLLTVVSARGPPLSRDTLRSHLTPPLRGPPSSVA